MLHTIVPMEQVFATECQPPSAGSFGGAPADIHQDCYGRPVLGRLYATNLQAYLGLNSVPLPKNR